MKIYTSVMDGATWNGSDEGVMTLDDTEGLINHIIENHDVATPYLMDVDKVTMTGATLGFLLGVVGVLIAQLIGSML